MLRRGTLIFLGSGLWIPAQLARPALARPASNAADEFDVASIKPNNSGKPGWILPPIARGRFTAANISLRALVEIAYGVQRSRVVGGPAWVDADRYDVDARGPADAKDSDVRLRLQELLAARFHLAVHRAMREMPAYVLTAVPNGAKLAPETSGDQGLYKSRGPGVASLMGRSASIAELAESLSEMLGRPVIDKTGIPGRFHFELTWSDDAPAGLVQNSEPGRDRDQEKTDAPSIFAALREKLGLRLAAEKVSVDSIVIDRAAPPLPN